MALRANSSTMTTANRNRRLRRRPGIVRTSTLRYEGLKPVSKNRYFAQLRRFFLYLRVMGKPMPSDAEDLDDVLAEYIDMCWQEDGSHGAVSQLYSALTRFLPRLKHNLPVSLRFLKNWTSLLVRRRALPFSPLLVRALAGLALSKNRADLASIILVSFAGMLRTMEGVRLQVSQVLLLPDHRSMITLTNAKTSGRHGGVEQVFIHDRIAVDALRLALHRLSGDDGIYRLPPRSFYGELRWLGAHFGIRRKDFLPYGLRRGRGDGPFHQVREL